LKEITGFKKSREGVVGTRKEFNVINILGGQGKVPISDGRESNFII